MTAAERREQRRERLLEAGLEVFATEGYASSSVRTICAAAELNSRYFYESFRSREDLLRAVYERIVEEIGTAVREATAAVDSVEAQAHAGLRASWKLYEEDPRKARIIALEVVGVSASMERLRRDTRHAFADLLVQNALSVAREDLQLALDPVLTARALTGGMMDILVDWINGDVAITADGIAEHFTRLFTASAYASVLDSAGNPLLHLVQGAERQATDRAEAVGRGSRNGRGATAPSAPNGAPARSGARARRS